MWNLLILKYCFPILSNHYAKLEGKKKKAFQATSYSTRNTCLQIKFHSIRWSNQGHQRCPTTCPKLETWYESDLRFLQCSLYIYHVLIHLITKFTIWHLLWIRGCSRKTLPVQKTEKKDENPCSHGVSILMRGNKQFNIMKGRHTISKISKVTRTRSAMYLSPISYIKFYVLQSFC